MCNRYSLPPSNLLSIVGCGGDISTPTGPVGVHMCARVVQSHISMGTKVITLGLDQVRWHGLVSVAIIEGQGSAEAWHWNAEFNTR